MQFEDINMSDLIYYCDNNNNTTSDNTATTHSPITTSPIPASNATSMAPCNQVLPAPVNMAPSSNTSSPSFDFAAALADVPPSFDMAANLSHTPLTNGCTSSAADYGPLSFDFAPFPSEQFFTDFSQFSEDYDLSTTNYDFEPGYDPINDVNAPPSSAVATPNYPVVSDGIHDLNMRPTYGIGSPTNDSFNHSAVPTSFKGSPTNQLADDNFLFDDMFDAPGYLIK